jgi:hypothetical protein
MERKNNVNPNHYKTAGRERPGEDIVQEIHKQKFTQAAAVKQNRDEKTVPQPETLEPGIQNEKPKQTVGQTNESANSSSNT